MEVIQPDQKGKEHVNSRQQRRAHSGQPEAGTLLTVATTESSYWSCMFSPNTLLGDYFSGALLFCLLLSQGVSK